MSVRVIIGLAVVLVVVLFAVQNTDPVALHLLFWEVSAPTAMMVALAFACGMLVGALFFWTEQRRTQRRQLPTSGGVTTAPLLAGAKSPLTVPKKKEKWWW